MGKSVVIGLYQVKLEHIIDLAFNFQLLEIMVTIYVLFNWIGGSY